MKIKKQIIFFTILFISILVFGSEESHSSVHHGFDWLGFIGKVFNSSVLFGGLYLLLRKPITSFLGQKSSDVKADIIDREKKIEEAKNELSDILNRLESIEDDIKILNNDAIKNGEVEKNKLKKIGEIESKRIMEISEEEINYKIESSIKSLRVRIAKMAVDRFKKTFKDDLNKSIHEKVIKDNIKICGDIIGNQTNSEAGK